MHFIETQLTCRNMDRQISQIFDTLKKKFKTKESSECLDEAYHSILEIIHNQYTKEMEDLLTQMSPIQWDENLLLSE